MGRPKKYQTDEERLAAAREQSCLRNAKWRAKQAAQEGREIKPRRKFSTDEEREQARREWNHKAKQKYRARLRAEGKKVK